MDKRKAILGSTMFTVLVMGALVGMMVLWNSQSVIETQILEPREWQPLETGAPGAGESGVVWVGIYPREVTPATAYAINCTNGNAYAYGTEVVTSGTNALTGNVPYDTAFDIVVRVRWNVTHALSSNNGTWMLPWVNASISAANDAGATTYFPIVALDMGEVNVSGCTTDTYIWVQYYVQAKTGSPPDGAGLQISHGDTVNCSTFQAWAFY